MSELTKYETDIAIIGAGAAGLAAAIFAGRRAREAGKTIQIDLIEGARKPGAKILVSGGGRCNVTNETVTPKDFWGGSQPTIRSVLKSFTQDQTIEWMRSLGIELKLEETGKYFPTTDSSQTVLFGLLDECERLGVKLWTSSRVESFGPTEQGFEVVAAGYRVCAKRLIIATGGLALPKSGSDGMGLGVLESLGHSIIPTTPALAPLILNQTDDPGGRLRELSGITINGRLRLSTASGKKVFEWTDSMVFTHFGLSGPGPMNISRHLARLWKEGQSGRPTLTLGHPDFADAKAADDWLIAQAKRNPGRSAFSLVASKWPDRMARILTDRLDRLGVMRKGERQDLARNMSDMPLPIAGDRGYTYAETTAGGVDLAEIDRRSMESRRIPGMHLCGEVLDVDGRIGGFNFQWAWATGRLAGHGAVDGIGK